MAKEELEEIEEEEEEQEESKETKKKEKKEDDIFEKPQYKYLVAKIEEYLHKEAKVNPLFKDKLDDPKKNIKDCVKYICSKAQEEHTAFVHHTQIFRWASDYYNDNVKVDSKINLPNGTVATESEEEDKELDSMITPEDKEKARKEALEEFKKEELKKLQEEQKKEQEKAKKAQEKEEQKKAKAAAKKKEEDSKKGFEALSLFDWED